MAPPADVDDAGHDLQAPPDMYWFVLHEGGGDLHASTDVEPAAENLPVAHAVHVSEEPPVPLVQ